MIKAINKQGREQYFTERVWGLMPKHKNGWVEWTQQGEVLVPQQIIEFQQKKKEAVVVDVKDETPVVEAPINPEPPQEIKTTDIPYPAKVDAKKKPLRKPVKRTKK